MCYLTIPCPIERKGAQKASASGRDAKHFGADPMCVHPEGALDTRGAGRSHDRPQSLPLTPPTINPSQHMKETSSTPTGPLQAPGFKEVRNYLRNIQQREALDGFIKAGWSPGELGEFAQQVFLAPRKTYPTAASYQYAIDKGADHSFAQETLASLRKRGATVPHFNRPVPKEYEWDCPDNPEHSPELRAEIEVMARLWRMLAGELFRLSGVPKGAGYERKYLNDALIEPPPN
jgi:hypothetical protein